MEDRLKITGKWGVSHSSKMLSSGEQTDILSSNAFCKFDESPTAPKFVLPPDVSAGLGIV
jgi:hypothetical protein